MEKQQTDAVRQNGLPGSERSAPGPLDPAPARTDRDGSAPTSGRGPLETKVVAGALGTGLGAAVGTFCTWLLGVTVWHVPNTAGDASQAIAAVPGPVSGLLVALTAVGSGVVAAYQAPHTERPDLTPRAGGAGPDSRR